MEPVQLSKTTETRFQKNSGAGEQGAVALGLVPQTCIQEWRQEEQDLEASLVCLRL